MESQWMDLNVQLSDADGGRCFALVAAIGMLRKRNPWNYVVMLTLLGGMIFHVFWEANPKYSICFMGVMMFMMVTGIENLCEEEKKEQKQKISTGNVMLCLVGIGLIVCLQPMHNYLKQNPEALDQSYAVSQFAQSQTLNLSLKKNEAIKQSFLTKIGFRILHSIYSIMRMILLCVCLMKQEK